MKKTLLILPLFLIISFSQIAAQEVLIGVTGGISSVTGPAAYTNDISAGGAGFSSEAHFGILSKFHFFISPITPVISFTLHTLRGNSNGTETSQNVYSIGTSLQFTLLAATVSPYIALDGSYNFFGKFNINNPPVLYSPDKSASSASALASKNRFGGGIGAGADLNLIKNIDIDLSIRFSIMNLLGSSASEDNINFMTVNAAILF
jgi:opacity protein-like surface antigen